MAVLCSEIWLLIGVVFVLQLTVIRGQLCQQGWTFHALTGSCMAIIRKHDKYLEARLHCEDYSSSTMKGKGHLVFIFNKATDDFVKGLLNEGRVTSALIGLYDQTGNGDYAWSHYPPIRVTYTGWADNPHTHALDEGAVVMTNDGWQEYTFFSQAYFVCQVILDFPTPSMVCPVAEVGQESPDITCTIDKRPSFTMTSLRFMQTAAVVASCNVDRCSPSRGYEHVVDVSKPQDTSSSVSWSLKLRNVIKSDETDWTCSVVFNNSGSWVASQPCSLKVYTKPADIQCSHMFVHGMVKTTCTAARVYPHVGCTWEVKYGTRKLHVCNLAISNDVVSAEGYYRATCNASFSITNVGTYVVAVVMKPNFGISTVKEISVSVASPQQPVQLYLAGQRLESLWVEVVENQTLNITCRVPGGDPEVYRAIINCNNIQQPFESDGSSVTMDVGVTRAFHGQNCTCSALYSANYTRTSSVEIRVTYPATVTSFRIFRIYGSSSSTVIRRGDEITFACTASGNPRSQLIVQRQNGPMLTNSSTGYTTYKKTATCSDMGSYVCLASNMVQGQPHEDRKVAHLQVRCAPELCSGMSSPRFPADVGAPSVSIKICVRAYPAPTLFRLYKGNTTDHRADKFQAYFNFTNEDDGLGELTVMVSPFAQEDIGDYLLYSEYKSVGVVVLHSHLTFSLFTQAPPQQPPQLYLAGQRLESLWVEVVENQTLNITCRVPGGDPEVYRTIIKCNNIQQPFESDGSSVTMDVGVTRAFHGQNCTCSALHAAIYTQTSSVEIRVTSPPQQPPHLYLAGQRLESLWVEVVENQTLNITCRVPGGDPEVYRTIINCNNTQQPFESDGSSVTMDVRVTRAFHGQNCTCSALHAASYTQTSSVEIRVTDPVTPDSKTGGSQAHYVGAIVGVIVAAILAIIIFAVIIFLLRKKGAPCKRKEHQYATTPINAVDTIDESGSRHVVEELPKVQAPEDPHYEEINYFWSDMPDKPVEYTNEVLSIAGDEEAEYADTV